MSIQNWENPLKNGGTYSSIVQKREIVDLQNDEVASIICLSENREYSLKCNGV